MTLLNRLIRTRRAEAQSAVARLICRQFPEHISLLIEFLNMPFARVLCFHAARGDLTSDAIIKIIRWMLRRNDVRSSSPVLGLLISPRLLASLADIDLALTNDMAATFGFVEVELASPKYKQQLQEFLSHGIYFINNAMLAIPLEEVLCNIAAIQRNMLIASGILVAKSSTQLIDGHHSDESNLEKPMHQGCFFAAIRENEHNELANCPLTNAFKFQAFQDEASDHVRFLHLPERLMKSLLITEPLRLAAQLFVPASLQSRFLLEYAMVRLQPQVQQTESMLHLRARWAALELTHYQNIESLRSTKTSDGNLRFPEAMLTVVRPDAIAALPFHPRANVSKLPAVNAKVVSPCANACLQLLDLLNHTKLSEVSAELETQEPRWADFLVPLGMEIQIPQVCDTKHIGWKELFQSIGVPSPRRPECGRMLELALPPSASWHACCHLLELVAELQIPQYEQDLAIHLSLQGEHGRILSDLCFTQLFLNTSSIRFPRPSSRMRHVMSKGLLHRNMDIVQCSWASPADCRTELRTVIAGVFNSEYGLRIGPDALASIREIHLISSAAASPSSNFRDLATQFSETLRSIVSTFPQSIQDLLEADFYESTGDYRAVELLSSMKILKLRENARRLAPELRSMLRQQLTELRCCITDRIELTWNSMTNSSQRTPDHPSDS